MGGLKDDDDDGEAERDSRPSASATEEDAPIPIPMGKTPEPPSKARSANRKRTLMIVLAPIVSVATLMMGLRVGAGNAVRSATIFVAPPGRPPAAGQPTPFAFQILTYLEDRGVRETIGMDGLIAIARSKGKEARWTGLSNPDGIAEVFFAIPDYVAGDPIDIEIRREGESSPLASGTVDAKMLAPKTTTTPWGRRKDDTGDRSAVRPSKREGPYGIDLLLDGERLVVGFQTVAWMHVSWPRIEDPAHRVQLTLDPEPGLEAGAPSLGCNGWTEVKLTAQAHVVGVKIEARDRLPAGDGVDPTLKGVWFGALPVAFGAFYASMSQVWREGDPPIAHIAAPNPRTVVYAEVDDEDGRVFAAALPVATADDPTSPFAQAIPKARFEMPVLAPGLHWLVVSGEPRGAEHMAGAAIARPFIVGAPSDPQVNPQKPCSVGPWLAHRPALGFPRTLALDGMATRGASNRVRHRAGLVIGLASLLIAAILEVLLLTAASREARAVLLLAELDEAGDHQITAKPPGGGVVIGILVALLGFALLGAMLIAKG